jgi:hypothetical protein
MEAFRSRRARVAAIAAVCLLALGGIAVADVATGGNARVSFHGWISPRVLPRSGSAPVSLHIGGTVHPLAGRRPAALKRVRIELNRHGLISTRGLARCPRRRLLGSTTASALAHCRAALVGHGRFSSNVEIPEGAPFPADGRVLAFNSVIDGRPGLVAQVYGTDPVPTDEVLPIAVRRSGEDGFGATLTVQMPNVGNEWGYVTGFEMTFHRIYGYRGRTRSFISASCPAPAGIGTAPFRAARGTYFLGGGRQLTRVVGGSCRVG